MLIVGLRLPRVLDEKNIIIQSIALSIYFQNKIVVDGPKYNTVGMVRLAPWHRLLLHKVGASHPVSIPPFNSRSQPTSTIL